MESRNVAGNCQQKIMLWVAGLETMPKWSGFEWTTCGPKGEMRVGVDDALVRGGREVTMRRPYMVFKAFAAPDVGVGLCPHVLESRSLLFLTNTITSTPHSVADRIRRPKRRYKGGAHSNRFNQNPCGMFDTTSTAPPIPSEISIVGDSPYPPARRISS